jgi:hypothetical protein
VESFDLTRLRCIEFLLKVCKHRRRKGLAACPDIEELG